MEAVRFHQEPSSVLEDEVTIRESVLSDQFYFKFDGREVVVGVALNDGVSVRIEEVAQLAGASEIGCWRSSATDQVEEWIPNKGAVGIDAREIDHISAHSVRTFET